MISTTSLAATGQCPGITANRSARVSFSAREREIIQGLSDDLSVKMIARTLCISAFTVQDHIKNIKQKMQVHTPGGIVAYAFRVGLIQ